MGSGEELTEDGIPSSLIQTFLDLILALAISPDQNVSVSSFKVIKISIEQGLVHPLSVYFFNKCVPAICAMETNSDQNIAHQAFFIHQKLCEQHSSFIHTKNLDSVQCIYKYQLSLSTNNKIQGTYYFLTFSK